MITHRGAKSVADSVIWGVGIVNSGTSAVNLGDPLFSAGHEMNAA